MMCSHCWSEAVSRHAGGMGEGESVTQVYSWLIDESWCKTVKGKRVIEMRKRAIAPPDTPTEP